MDISILGRKVTILGVNGIPEEGTQGQWLPDLDVIVLDVSLHPDIVARNLVHEVAHVVFQQTGNPDRTLDEEDFATLCELFLGIFKNRE